MRMLRELHAGPEIQEGGKDPGIPDGSGIQDDAAEAGSGCGTVSKIRRLDMAFDFKKEL